MQEIMLYFACTFTGNMACMGLYLGVVLAVHDLGAWPLYTSQLAFFIGVAAIITRFTHAHEKPRAELYLCTMQF